MRRHYTAISRGWLGLFSLIYIVLLIVFGVGLGFALSFGNTARMQHALTNKTSLTSFQQTITASATRTMLKAGLPAVPQGQLVARSTLARGLKTGLAVSANFGEVPQKSKAIDWDYVSTDPDSPSHLTLAPMLNAIDRHTVRAMKKQGQAYPQALRTKVKAAVKAHFDSIILGTMMTHGLGLAYPMFVLFMQTAAIVGAILGVIVLLIMRVTSHSWLRWLRVAGRLTYIIALLAGIVTLIAAAPSLTRYIKLGGVPNTVVQQLQAALVPTWQRVAGVVAIVGFAVAGLAQVLRLRQRGQSDRSD